jgi:hypothetical protein
MVAAAVQESEGDRHPLDAYVNDPSDMPPLCDEEEFAQLLAEMVADCVPKLFAVVEEYGDRVDAACVAWGMAFEDCAFVVSDDGTLKFCVSSPERALRFFARGTFIRPRLIWP